MKRIIITEAIIAAIMLAGFVSSLIYIIKGELWCIITGVFSAFFFCKSIEDTLRTIRYYRFKNKRRHVNDYKVL